MSLLKIKIYRLLRWSEKYTKTDMVYLAKGGFWLTLGQIISSLSSFLLAIAFANLLPKETYGTYKYVLSIVGILSIPTLAGMNTAVTRAVARGDEGSFLPALKSKIKWGLLGGISSLILAGYYYFNDNQALTFTFLITAIFIPFIDSFALYGALLQGKKKFDIASKYGILIKIIASGSIFLTIYFTKNLLVILFVYLASYTFLRLIILKLSLKFVINNKKEDPETISYGKHLSLIGVVNIFASYLDKLLIFHYLGSAELAIYSFAIAPVNQIKMLSKNINALVLPKLSQRPAKKIDSLMLKRLFFLLITGLLMMLIYVIIAPFLYNLIFPKYSESIMLSQIFSLKIPFALLIAFLDSAITSKLTKVPKNIYYKLGIYPNIFLIMLLLYLTPLLGILGVILAKILSTFR